MKSIEKLQKQVDELQAECEARGRALESNLKRIHELESECSECCYKQEFDNIEQRYMPLPVDKNGEVVRIGDELYYEGYNQQFKVGCISIQYAHAYVKDAPNGDTWKPEECVHVKSDPLKELLVDMGEEIWNTCCTCQTTWSDSGLDGIEERYAERIREALGVD